MAEPTDGEFDLNTLNDEELVEQVHDDLYNGLKPEVEEATHIFLKRGWSAERVLNDALVEGMRIVGIDFRDGILFVPEVLLAAKRNRRWAAPGVWVAPVMRDRRTGERSYLLGIGRGIAVPKHTHKGVEMTCVLTGAYSERGNTHRAGDFAEVDEEVEHKPRVTWDGECVCLIAADNALVARDLFGWIMQPFVRI